MIRTRHPIAGSSRAQCKRHAHHAVRRRPSQYGCCGVCRPGRLYPDRAFCRGLPLSFRQDALGDAPVRQKTLSLRPIKFCQNRIVERKRVGLASPDRQALPPRVKELVPRGCDRAPDRARFLACCSQKRAIGWRIAPNIATLKTVSVSRTQPLPNTAPK